MQVSMLVSSKVIKLVSYWELHWARSWALHQAQLKVLHQEYSQVSYLEKKQVQPQVHLLESMSELLKEHKSVCMMAQKTAFLLQVDMQDTENQVHMQVNMLAMIQGQKNFHLVQMKVSKKEYQKGVSLLVASLGVQMVAKLVYRSEESLAQWLV